MCIRDSLQRGLHASQMACLQVSVPSKKVDRRTVSALSRTGDPRPSSGLWKMDARQRQLADRRGGIRAWDHRFQRLGLHVSRRACRLGAAFRQTIRPACLPLHRPASHQLPSHRPAFHRLVFRTRPREGRPMVSSPAVILVDRRPCGLCLFVRVDIRKGLIGECRMVAA